MKTQKNSKRVLKYLITYEKWDNMEAEDGPLRKFGKWFYLYKSTIVKNSMPVASRYYVL